MSPKRRHLPFFSFDSIGWICSNQRRATWIYYCPSLDVPLQSIKREKFIGCFEIFDVSSVFFYFSHFPSSFRFLFIEFNFDYHQPNDCQSIRFEWRCSWIFIVCCAIIDWIWIEINESEFSYKLRLLHRFELDDLSLRRPISISVIWRIFRMFLSFFSWPVLIISWLRIGKL